MDRNYAVKVKVTLDAEIELDIALDDGLTPEEKEQLMENYIRDYLELEMTSPAEDDVPCADLATMEITDIRPEVKSIEEEL